MSIEAAQRPASVAGVRRRSRGIHSPHPFRSSRHRTVRSPQLRGCDDRAVRERHAGRDVSGRFRRDRALGDRALGTRGRFPGGHESLGHTSARADQRVRPTPPGVRLPRRHPHGGLRPLLRFPGGAHVDVSGPVSCGRRPSAHGAEPRGRRRVPELVATGRPPRRGPSTARAIFTMSRNSDVRDLLTQVQAPTLVLHAVGNNFVRADHGRYLAAHISKSRFIEIDSADHLPWTNDTDTVEKSRNSGRGPGMCRRGMALGHGALHRHRRVHRDSASLGDNLWRDRLDRHDVLANERSPGSAVRL